MKGLDLSKFKKVRSGAKHTVLRHPSGHEITVFHNKLKPEVKSELDKLPNYDEGGEVEDPRKQGEDSLRKAFKAAPSPSPAPETPSDRYERIRKQNRANIGYAEGGQVPASPPIDKDKAKQVSDSFKKVFADGGEVKGNTQVVPASQLEANYTAENAIAQGDSPKAAEGQAWADQIGNEVPNVDPNAPIAPADNSHAHLAEAVKNLSQKFVASTPQANPAQPVPQMTPPEQQMQQPAPQQVMDPGQPKGGLVQQAQQDTNIANQAENAAASNIQQAQGQNAEIYGQKAQQLQDLHQKYEEAGNQIHQKFEDLSAQVEQGHINPHQWWDNKGTGSKIMTAIGMMFAGAGLGASGHPELASKAIDDAVNRDIDAQKSDLSNKQSLLGKYMEMYRSLPEAEAAARLTLQASVEGLINQQAAKLGSQNAQNAATIANAQRRQQLLPQLEGLARGQAMMGMYSSMGKQGGEASGSEAAHQKMLHDLSVLNPERYKIEEAKYLPGIGVATKPMPDKVTEEITARKDLSEKLAELENFSREHSGTVMDRKIVNQGAALARNVQDAYRRGNAQGVFKESEKDFVEKSISSDPTAFFSKIRTIPGYQTVRKLNDDTIKHYQKAYGVKPFQDHQSGNQNQAAMEWLKANPNDPRAAAVKAKLGI